MSHDALFTREISDFYNVPIDSDIYAFPVDMIEQQQQQLVEEQQQKPTAPTYHKASRRNKRNKRKQRYAGSGTGAGTETSDGDGEKSKHGKYRTPVGVGMGQVTESEPLHMTLDEVKQFYHTLYSDAGKPAPKPMVKSSNETIWSVSTNTTTTTARTRSSVGTTRAGGGPPGAANGAGGASSDGGIGGGGGSGAGGKYLSKQNKHNLDNDKLNNNNNNNHQPSQQQLEKPPTEHHNHNQLQPPNNKHVLHSEKKSQFTLNLKQRFCSIFRFRRSNHSRCRGSGGGQTGTLANANAGATAPLIPPAAVITSAPGAAGQPQLATELNGGGAGGASITAEADEPNADLRKKFQSRALPPLPKKGECSAPPLPVNQSLKAIYTLLCPP